MMKPLKLLVYAAAILLFPACNQSATERTSPAVTDGATSDSAAPKPQKQPEAQKQNPTDYVPKGYVLFEKIPGDLNQDGLDDCVLIIKGTDKNMLFTDEHRGTLDRNRRGLIILLQKDHQYRMAVQNHACFSSENEDGGVYFPPELSVAIEKGQLFVRYEHGRYGFWQYQFRYRDPDFELIGYEAREGGVVTDRETSINFLSKKKHEKVNTNKNAEGGDEVFHESWQNIQLKRRIHLSEIQDFDTLDMHRY